MGDPVLQFRIISKAPEDTAGFYASLFRRKVDANNSMGYRQIDTGSKAGIQGGIWPAPPSLAQAVELGAKVVIPPASLPESEEMAVLHDPQGMSFVVWRPA